MSSIIVKNYENLVIKNNPSISLLNNILMSKTEIETICGGRAVCGKCRIQILSSSKYLTPVKNVEKLRLKNLINEGWRLACQTYSLKDITIYIPPKGSNE